MSEAIKLIFDLVGAAITAKAGQRADILARLVVALEDLDKANATEDADHATRTAETRAIIAQALPDPNK